MQKQTVTHDEQGTMACASNVAKGLQGGDVVLLHGDLGMGKSVFCRSIIRTLCGDADMEVPSPTFTLVQVYEGKGVPIWHFDLYRLSDPSEVYELGWEEALAGGIVLVEWPERLGSLLPAHRMDVMLSAIPDQPDHRKIEIEAHA